MTAFTYSYDYPSNPLSAIFTPDGDSDPLTTRSGRGVKRMVGQDLVGTKRVSGKARENSEVNSYLDLVEMKRVKYVDEVHLGG